MSEVQRTKKTVTVDVCHTYCFNGYDAYDLKEQVYGSLYRLDSGVFILAYDTMVDYQKTTVTYKTTQNTISMVSIGEVHSRHHYTLDGHGSHQYFYGGASMIQRNRTKKLEHSLSPEGGYIEITYEIFSGDLCMGYFHDELFIS